MRPANFVNGQTQSALPGVGPRACLALTLGLTTDHSSEPYINYIESLWPGRGEKNSYLRFFAEVVKRFTTKPPTILVFLNELVIDPHHYFFDDSLPNSNSRVAAVKDGVLLVIGTWLLMHSYFIPARLDQRRILLAYCVTQKLAYSEEAALAQSLPDLVSRSSLLPNPFENSIVESGTHEDAHGGIEMASFSLHASAGLLESLTIDIKRLNAVRLSSLARVKFTWTTNLSRHLLLSQHGDRYYLELFALPCALQGGAVQILDTMGISADLIEEIENSYATLFHPTKASRIHRSFQNLVGLRRFCWCLSCRSRRLRNRVLASIQQVKSKQHGIKFDPMLKALMKNDATEWNQTEYAQLWPRIMALDSHLRQTKPWSFSVLFRDRRDTVQYWTFL